MPTTEPMLTMAPDSCRSMWGNVCLQVRNMLETLTPHHPLPAFFAGLHRATQLDDADVVVEDVDAAKRLDGTVDHGEDLLGVGYVGLHGHALTTLRFDDVCRLLHCLCADVGGDDLRALAGEQHRRRLAVAPAGSRGSGAGDDGDLVHQAVDHQAPASNRSSRRSARAIFAASVSRAMMRCRAERATPSPCSASSKAISSRFSV